MCGHGCAVGLVQRLASHMEEQVEVSSMSLFKLHPLPQFQ